MTSELVMEMRRRFRRHMLTSFGGIFAGVLVCALAGALTRAAGLPQAIAHCGVLLGIFTIPIVGFYSTKTNLRCPACGGGVGFQVSANASIMAASAKKTCRHCGARIFH